VEAAGKAARAEVFRAPVVGPPADGLEVIRDDDGFAALAGEWSSLLARCEANHPFNSHPWLSAWYRHFGVGRPVEVLAVRRGGRLVCCLPTIAGEPVRLHGHSFRRRTLWVNTHSFRSGVLCDPAHLDALDPVADHLAAADDWDLMDLPYLPHGMAANRALMAALARRGIAARSRRGMVSPRLAIHGTWDEYLGSQSRSRRESVRRLRRKVLEKSDGRVEITRGHAADLEARLEACWAISTHTWKHRQGSSIAADPARAAFYRSVAMDGPDWLVLGLLHLDGQPIAFEYDLLYEGVLYNLKLGYDEAFEKASPGLALRIELLRWAHENKVAVYDYMGPTADYKARFGTDSVAHDNLRLYGRTAPARLLHLYEAWLRPAAGWVRRRLSGRRAASPEAGEAS
jgi:CelD/BcsL family acetyltransferase involved in cellulose biosynthesis